MERRYKIEFLENGHYSDVQCRFIYAKNRADAYGEFLKEYGYVFAAWVASYITKDGKEHTFNTFAGNPY